MHIKNKRGQSTVEYVLLMTAVVAVIILFVANQGKGGFQGQLNSTLNDATQEMGTMSGKFSASHASQPAPTGSDAPPYSVNVDAGV
jgi:uncharacterized protein (UPF0333 family)